MYFPLHRDDGEGVLATIKNQLRGRAVVGLFTKPGCSDFRQELEPMIVWPKFSLQHP
jgi:hypothetical protein